MTTVTEVNPRLKRLTEAGVSVWLDQIRRSLVTGGELARMAAEESLRGVTANPSIFEKAILGSSDYDEDLVEMAREQLDAHAIYERLAIRDVQMAADVLAGVHRESGGALLLLSLRPEALSKGIRVKTSSYARHHINVTMARAKMSGTYPNSVLATLEATMHGYDEGLLLDVNSVASFFVSRVDTNVDKKLEALGRTDLEGRAAIANARAAYRLFKEMFDGPRWEPLRHAGAVVQRPLWASTSAKNPSYPDTIYVDELVGPHTVNTMPLQTLLAVADHGEVTGPTAERDPEPDLRALADAGIDMDQVTDELLADGLLQFDDAMARLHAGIDERRAAVAMGRPTTIDAKLPSDLQGPVAARVKRAVDDNVAQRVWRRDPSLWGGPGVPEIEDRLGWLTVSETMLEHAEELEAFAEQVRDEGFTDAVLLGMGGSSLGPEVIRRSFGGIPGGLRLQVLDSTHPDVVLGVQESVDMEKTLFIVSSKSGGTVETLSHYHHFRAYAEPSQFVVVTDPGSPLEQLARDDGLRHAFLNTPDIGGRYSVMSLFGLVPAALAGVNVEALLHRCQVGEQNCAHYDSSESNSGLWLGAVIGELARQGRDKLTFIVSPPIESFGLWVEQLVAESTGKHGRGILPVADEPIGPPEVYATATSRTLVSTRLPSGWPMPGSRSSRLPPMGPSISGACSSFRSSASRCQAGRSKSTRSTSPTCRRQRTTRNGYSTRDRSRSSRRRTTMRCASCWATRIRPITSRSWATCLTRTSWTRRPATYAPRSARPPERRRRSVTGLASCTRQASCTRGARPRAGSCSWSAIRNGTRRSRGRGIRSGR